MSTTRQDILAKRQRGPGVAGLKADSRDSVIAEIARRYQIHNDPGNHYVKALVEAFEAGRAYPRRHAKGRAR